MADWLDRPWFVRPIVPATLELLSKLYAGKCARDFLPSMTIVYMGPGGHRRRQWSKGIKAILERFSLLIAFTRQKALEHLKESFKESLKTLPKWKPLYRQGKRGNDIVVDIAVPAPPFKFLDTGNPMGLYKIEGLTPNPRRNHAEHPRPTGQIAVPNACHEALHYRLGPTLQGDLPW